jgi:hypothetical protein
LEASYCIYIFCYDKTDTIKSPILFTSGLSLTIEENNVHAKTIDKDDKRLIICKIMLVFLSRYLQLFTMCLYRNLHIRAGVGALALLFYTIHTNTKKWLNIFIYNLVPEIVKFTIPKNHIKINFIFYGLL